MTSAYFDHLDDVPRLPPSSSAPPHHPPVTLPHRATVRVDMTGRWPRLLVVWPEHPPRHVMHAVQHQLAALVWARSGDASWDVRVGAGAERGNCPAVWVELVLWHDQRYPHQRLAEDVLERVRGEVERGQR